MKEARGAGRIPTMEQHARYTYQVRWSELDGEWIARCLEFPSLSWLSGSPAGALEGIFRVVKGVLADMQRSGETAPRPLNEG